MIINETNEMRINGEMLKDDYFNGLQFHLYIKPLTKTSNETIIKRNTYLQKMQAFIRITKEYVIDISMKFGINKYNHSGSISFSYCFYRPKLKRFIGYMQNVQNDVQI